MYDRLTKIDDLTRRDHWYLTEEDDCYYFGEYTARQGYAYSVTNQLIANLKKPVDRRGREEYKYKERAIIDVAGLLQNLIKPDSVTFVPIPPSKSKSDPLYDDRLVRILNAFKQQAPSVDYRELIVQTKSTPAAHETADRRDPDELRSIYAFDEGVATGIRENLLVFDDVLTTGSHFKAVQSMLRDRYPDHNIAGIFVARRVPESIDPLDVFG